MNVDGFWIFGFPNPVEQSGMLADEQICVGRIGESVETNSPSIHSILLIADHLGEIRRQAVVLGELGFRLPFNPTIVVLGDGKDCLRTQSRWVYDGGELPQSVEAMISPVRCESTCELSVVRLRHQPELIIYFCFKHGLMGCGLRFAVCLVAGRSGGSRFSIPCYPSGQRLNRSSWPSRRPIPRCCQRYAVSV